MKSGLIRGMVFGGNGLIRERLLYFAMSVHLKSDLIRGLGRVVFDGSGLIREGLMYLTISVHLT
jgi:hypothetical protein